jgi:hypothetical protein
MTDFKTSNAELFYEIKHVFFFLNFLDMTRTISGSLNCQKVAGGVFLLTPLNSEIISYEMDVF